MTLHACDENSKLVEARRNRLTMVHHNHHRLQLDMDPRISSRASWRALLLRVGPDLLHLHKISPRASRACLRT